MSVSRLGFFPPRWKPIFSTGGDSYVNAYVRPTWIVLRRRDVRSIRHPRIPPESCNPSTLTRLSSYYFHFHFQQTHKKIYLLHVAPVSFDYALWNKNSVSEILTNNASSTAMFLTSPIIVPANDDKPQRGNPRLNVPSTWCGTTQQ